MRIVIIILKSNNLYLKVLKAIKKLEAVNLDLHLVSETITASKAYYLLLNFVFEIKYYYYYTTLKH